MSTEREVLRPLTRRFYRRNPREVALGLLGRYLVRVRRGKALTVRIVETEAYLGEGDRASHAWRGRPTKRTATLFRAGGCAYVYFVYGMHNMLNAVAGNEGVGGAVLIRAAEPVSGAAAMRRLRGLPVDAPEERIANGPGRLCQALAIDRTFDGAALDAQALRICCGRPVRRRGIVVGERIGVDYAGGAAAWPLRFAVRGNRHVSTPRPESELSPWTRPPEGELPGGG